MPLPRKLRWPLVGLAWIVGLAMFYVLSIGPVGFIIEAMNISIFDDADVFVLEVVSAIYSPLNSIPQDSAAWKALDWYAEFWDPERSPSK